MLSHDKFRLNLFYIYLIMKINVKCAYMFYYMFNTHYHKIYNIHAIGNK